MFLSIMLLMIQINTLTSTYDKLEDRIRLCVNYKDINNRVDFMVTRAFILELIPSLEEYIESYYPNNKKVIIENNKQNIKVPVRETPKQANKQNSLPLEKTNMEDLALYKVKDELLVSTKLSFDKEKKYTFIKFISKNKTEASLNCDLTMLENIIYTLKSSIPSLNWGISKHF